MNRSERTQWLIRNISISIQFKLLIFIFSSRLRGKLYARTAEKSLIRLEENPTISRSPSRCPPSNKMRAHRILFLFFSLRRYRELISADYIRVVLRCKLDRIAFRTLRNIRVIDLRFSSALSILRPIYRIPEILWIVRAPLALYLCNEENGSSSCLETGCQEVSSNSNSYSLDRSPT